MRLLLLLALLLGDALGREGGEWGADAATQRWYRELMQPDNPEVSCCGLADAYWSDSFRVDDRGRTVAIITDTRADAPLGRPHIPPGTEIIVPDHKLKYDAGNPTGHGVIFITARTNVLCYVQPGGV